MSAGKTSRIERLTTADEPDGPDSVLCPCCAAPLPVDPADGPGCQQCGYPQNSAAWVDYDGCC